MNDVREVGAELQRLADTEQFEPIDTAGLLNRGRRGLRRRRILTGAGALTGVAVVALGVALVPNLTSASQQPAVAGQQQSALFGPVPGVPSGEDGVDQDISKEEAERRCALRYPSETRSLQGTGKFRSVRTAMYDREVAGKEPAFCTIPGGDKPSAALVAEVEKNPLPADHAGQLKACSVQAWTDLTNWTVVAADHSKAVGKATLVALSPSRKKAVNCTLQSEDGSPWYELTVVSSLTLAKVHPERDPAIPAAAGAERPDLFAGGGGGGECKNGSCTGDVYAGWGRVASNATKVLMRYGAATAPYEVPVTDGWFAYVWQVKGNHTMQDAMTATAYDKNNKVVRVLGGQ